MVAMAGSFLVSYAHARAQGIGLRPTSASRRGPSASSWSSSAWRLPGFGFTVGLIGILVILAGLTVITVIQRIRHVWRLSQAATPDSKES